MNLLLKLLPQDLPAFIREEILQELFVATALTFKCSAPELEHLPFNECLQAYALFTREQAETVLQSGRNAQAIKTQLYRNAYPLGVKLRNWFAVDTLEEVMALGQILYRAIGVEIVFDTTGEASGEVTVTRCYFSQFYTSPVCDLISGLDDGVFSGLSGGCRLAFSERLTEGRPCCRALLQPGEAGFGSQLFEEQLR